MTFKIQRWPLDWEKHIVKYCEIYFCDKDIIYLDKKFWTEDRLKSRNKVTSISLSFKIDKYEYMVSISHICGANFICDVFYRETFAEGEEPIDIYTIQSGTKYVCMLENIAGFGSSDTSVNNIISFAEQSIWSDYDRRNRGDWDRDDGEDDPIEPPPPSHNLIETLEVLNI